MVSIIIPVYKVEKYLSKCIESIFKQTYFDLELILVDDGSTRHLRATPLQSARKFVIHMQVKMKELL